jgi:YbbR domain-containing protein
MEAVRSFLSEAWAVARALVVPAVRSLRENTGLAAVSVVLAFGVWIAVVDAENPTRTQLLEDAVPVQPINVGSDVAVANALTPVQVVVRAEEDVFESLTAADFQATVDLSNFITGSYELPVEVSTDRRGVRIEDVRPREIKVELAPLKQKTVPLTIIPEGELPAGYTMQGPETTVQTVRVSGPAGQVDQVTRAVGVVNVTGRTEPVDQAVRVEPRNELNVLIPRVEVDPAIVDVFIEIEQTVFSRPVAVSPRLTGDPARGYNVVDVSVEPAVVTITGPRGTIDAVESISTRGVSIEGAEEEFTQEVSLELPPEVQVIGRPTVEVTVVVEPARGSVRLAVPVEARNVDPGLRVAGTLPVADVLLTGELPALQDLTPQDVSASVNMNGRGEGAHDADVEVFLPNGVDADVKVTPSRITVTLERR